MSSELRAADLDTLRSATETRDAEALSSLYAENAELHIVDRLHPPSAPMTLRGRAAIHTFLADVCARDMTHHIRDEVVSTDRWAFTEACQYADGTRVLCMATADLADGKIVRQTNLQAWDE